MVPTSARALPSAGARNSTSYRFGEGLRSDQFGRRRPGHDGSVGPFRLRGQEPAERPTSGLGDRGHADRHHGRDCGGAGRSVGSRRRPTRPLPRSARLGPASRRFPRPAKRRRGLDPETARPHPAAASGFRSARRAVMARRQLRSRSHRGTGQLNSAFLTGSSAAWLARSVRDAEAAGSNPAFPTRSEGSAGLSGWV